MPHLSPGPILPTIVAAVAAFLLGGLWYSPLLFARQWVAAHGYSPEQVAQMRANAPRTYAISFLCFLLLAQVLAWLTHVTGATDWQGGAHLGFLCWLGFAFTLGVTGLVYSDKKVATFLIDTGYQLLYLMGMGAILAAWQ